MGRSEEGPGRLHSCSQRVRVTRARTWLRKLVRGPESVFELGKTNGPPRRARAFAFGLRKSAAYGARTWLKEFVRGPDLFFWLEETNGPRGAGGPLDLGSQECGLQGHGPYLRRLGRVRTFPNGPPRKGGGVAGSSQQMRVTRASTWSTNLIRNRPSHILDRTNGAQLCGVPSSSKDADWRSLKRGKVEGAGPASFDTVSRRPNQQTREESVLIHRP